MGELIRLFDCGEDHTIVFTVQDYGIGIDKEELEKIFERFYRVKGEKEQSFPGFGIGLFIARQFIEKHGGQIRVESKNGQGSRFSFILPLDTGTVD